jgi:hypothetical protein
VFLLRNSASSSVADKCTLISWRYAILPNVDPSLFTCTRKRVQARRQDRTGVQHYSRRRPPSRPRAPRRQIDDDDSPVPHVKLRESFVTSTREGWGRTGESGTMICSSHRTSIRSSSNSHSCCFPYAFLMHFHHPICLHPHLRLQLSLSDDSLHHPRWDHRQRYLHQARATEK